MTGAPEALAEGLLLASALREHAGNGSFSFAMKELAKTCDNLEMAESVGRLVGASHIGRGVWSTAPGQNAQRVDIPPHLFRDYLEEWACYLPACDLRRPKTISEFKCGYR